jgi:hypothetical protein
LFSFESENEKLKIICGSLKQKSKQQHEKRKIKTEKEKLKQMMEKFEREKLLMA